MFMICVSSLGGVHGQDTIPMPGGSSRGLPTYHEGKARYHGEALIIGGSMKLSHGAENFQYPPGGDSKIVFRKCYFTKGHCDANNDQANNTNADGLVGGTDVGLDLFGFTGGNLPSNGVCRPFNRTKVAGPTEAQSPPAMEGYTICGCRTQLTVYPDDANCGEDSINYKTIGHCDPKCLNTTSDIAPLTQCWSVRSALNDRLHAKTVAYKLTPCNFDADIKPRPIKPEGQVYRGPNGQEGGGAIGQITGSDIAPEDQAWWQERMVDGSDSQNQGEPDERMGQRR